MTTKEKVLSALTSLKNDEFFSGEELASDCSVSRTAIWKAIRSLQEEGYKIEAVTNRGYRILSKPDNLDSSEISQKIKSAHQCDLKVFVFKSIDSTNSEAKRRAIEAGAFRDENGTLTQGGKAANLSLFVAESQTGGKGRLGRTFLSPKDTGVYFSLLYSPENGIKNPALYTAAASLAVVRAISKLYGEEAQIKWVNDVFLAEKKVSGILVEGIANFETGNIDAAIVGIGINIKQNKNLSGDIAKIVGSIEEAKLSQNKTFTPRTKNELVSEVVSNLLNFYDNFGKNDEKSINEMICEYRSKSMLAGRTVTVNPVAGTKGTSYQAKVKDVDEEMRLVVECPDGEIKKLNSGEVSLHSYDFTPVSPHM